MTDGTSRWLSPTFDATSPSYTASGSDALNDLLTRSPTRRRQRHSQGRTIHSGDTARGVDYALADADAATAGDQETCQPVGDNTITVTVTGDRRRRTYTVKVTRIAASDAR